MCRSINMTNHNVFNASNMNTEKQFSEIMTIMGR